MTDPVEFEVTYTEHEFVRGLMYFQHRAGRSLAGMGLSVISVCIGFCLAYWFIVRVPGPFTINDAAVGLIVLVVSFPVSFVLDRFRPSVEGSFTRMFRNNPIFRERFNIRIDRTGIESKSASFESLHRWDAFSEGFESDDDFFFTIADTQPLYFPKRAFTPEQMERVRGLASDQMRAKAKFLR